MPESLLWVFLLLLPVVVQGQAPRTPDVIGPLRADGIARPFVEWADSSWFVVDYDSTRWEHAGRYRWTDSSGHRQWVEADSVVRIAGEGSFDGIYGHRTSLPDPVEDWRDRRRYVGYVVSDTAADVHFAGRPSDTPGVRSLLDSLAPLANQAGVEIQGAIWRASLDGTAVEFVEAVRWDGGTGFGSCFVAHQWRDFRSGSTQIVSSGNDDCEVKGHVRRRPWALLKRGQDLFAFVIVTRWDGDAAEIWMRRDDGIWSRVELRASGEQSLAPVALNVDLSFGLTLTEIEDGGSPSRSDARLSLAPDTMIVSGKVALP